MIRRMAPLVALAGLLLALAATPAVAGKGGNGNGKPGATTSTAGCTVEGTIVHGFGLPTSELVNFLAVDGGGTWGWVLGFTDTGNWSVAVPPRSGPTTYEFVSRTWGPNGSKYTVFARCSA